MNFNIKLILNNALDCKRSNEALNILIRETIINLDCHIDSLIDSQDYLLSQLKQSNDSTDNAMLKKLDCQKWFHIRKPYFTSKHRFTPFTSETEKLRESHGSLDFYGIKYQLSKFCSEIDLEILKRSISRNIYRIELAKIKQSGYENCVKELDSLQQKSPNELLRLCDTDMAKQIDWLAISYDKFPGKLSEQDCRRIYDQIIRVKFAAKRWTKSENQQLLNLVSEMGPAGHWVEIANKMDTKRDPISCYKQWLKLTENNETNNEWTSEEDERLNGVVANTKWFNTSLRYINWKEVSRLLPDRTAADCRKRWDSLRLSIIRRPFTDDEDYQLLVLVKKIGADRWPDIAREMDQRSTDECQRRFSKITIDFFDWNYLDDRYLWMMLKENFRTMLENDPIENNPTTDLSVYKNVMEGLCNHNPIVIRYRYMHLCKWFHIWNEYFILSRESKVSKSSITMSLLSDNTGETAPILKQCKDVFLNSKLFDVVRDALAAARSTNLDRETYELIDMIMSGNVELVADLMKKSNNKKLVDLVYAIQDMSNGTFIPIKFEDYLDRSCIGLQYPDRCLDNRVVQSANVRNLKIKMVIAKTVRTKMRQIVRHKNIKERERRCIASLLRCEGTFTAALNTALSSLEISRHFKFLIGIDFHIALFPDILKAMAEYVLAKQYRPVPIDDIALFPLSRLYGHRDRIAQLMIYRVLIPYIYKTFRDPKKHCLITQSLPSCVARNLTRKRDRDAAAKNVLDKLSTKVKYGSLDREVVASRVDCSDTINDLEPLHPDRAKFNFLRSLFLQKENLLADGKEEFIRIIRGRYENSADPSDNERNISAPRAVDAAPVHLFDQRYQLLRSRLLSSMSLSSVVASIPPAACAIAGDKLHQQQNDSESSARVSQSYNVVSLPRDVPCRFRKQTPRRQNAFGFIDDEFFCLPGKEERTATTIANSQPVKKRMMRSWTKLFAPEANRFFFVSKTISKFMLMNGAEIESINGVSVADIVQ